MWEAKDILPSMVRCEFSLQSDTFALLLPVKDQAAYFFAACSMLGAAFARSSAFITA
jgi:hypothetical protein